MGRRHTHKYYLGLRVGADIVWACGIEGCQHYMPHHMRDNVNHKTSICWKCGYVGTVEFANIPEYKEEMGKFFCESCLAEIARVKHARSNPKPNPQPEPKPDETEVIEPSSDSVQICKKCHKEVPHGLPYYNGMCGDCFMA